MELSDDSSSSLFDDNTDDDADYNPAKENNCDGISSSEEDQPEEIAAEQGPPAKRLKHPGRKKTQRTEEWKRNKSSKLRNMGEKYTDRKGKVHNERKLQEYNHECRFKCCENISEERRQKFFSEYWGLASWELQSSFLNSAIILGEPSRKKENAVRGNSLSCQYSLDGVRVCKDFFLKTLDVSNKRVTNIIANKKISGTGISTRDQRGRKVPTNKIDMERTDLVKKHIAMFPRYSSHYSRQQAPDRKYLNTDLNLKKCMTVTNYFVRNKEKSQLLYLTTDIYLIHVLILHFIDHIVTLIISDTNNCDKFKSAIEHGDQEAKDAATIAKEVHLHKAESAKNEMCRAKKDVEKGVTHRAVCFDLQKMLPTPVLTCCVQ